MIKVSGIDHVVLRTDRMDAMIAFYCEVLGCEVERTLSSEFGLVQLRAGNALIDLVDVSGELGQMGGGPPSDKNNNLDHFCLQIEPLPEEQVRTFLGQHGIDAGEFSRRYGAQGFGNSVYIRDPQGNTVELRSRQS